MKHLITKYRFSITLVFGHHWLHSVRSFGQSCSTRCNLIQQRFACNMLHPFSMGLSGLHGKVNPFAAFLFLFAVTSRLAALLLNLSLLPTLSMNQVHCSASVLLTTILPTKEWAEFVTRGIPLAFIQSARAVLSLVSDG